MSITQTQRDILTAQAEMLRAQATSYEAIVAAIPAEAAYVGGIGDGIPEMNEDEAFLLASGTGQAAVQAATSAVNNVLAWVGQLFDGE